MDHGPVGQFTGPFLLRDSAIARSLPRHIDTRPHRASNRIGRIQVARTESERSLKTFVEVTGWIAAVMILLAYALLSAGKLDGRSALYHLMNVVGAAGFVLNSGYNGALPSAALNVIWIGIGVYGLIRYRTHAG
jgi:hypothetical protein